ncbi:uncharacterized membrane protein YciS (DUF1049 family) [Clostridium punense]|uniref:Uncharacterized membrane protein YciS (DUF1049 family) n=1 Tax=Clostridium punense TaxID=1054297 RepID=A0ABS4K052_9CLOT|nr:MULTISPECIES: hypothetical protein [Clostridium]EQB88389.1 hypothetical protein M918_04405 [Clostridium sp. BL8]MBP2021167.1 uncharacterized membrane protein YciS (DUF1049 family) [Clostridium punense]
MKKKIFLPVIGVAIAALIGGGYYINSNSKVKDSSATKQAEDQAQKNESETVELEKKQEQEKAAIENAKSVDEKVAEDTVKKLIDIVYFKQGTYEEYKSLFSLPDRVASKEKFEEARSKSSVVEKFGKEYENSEEIVKNFKVEKKDSITTVFFKSEDGEKESTWQVIEKDSKYLIYNAVISQ